MSKTSRRKFLGTAAGATAVSAFPHVWIRPAWAQAKEVRILAWTHFVPAYDKWYDAVRRAVEHQDRDQGHHRPHPAPADPGQDRGRGRDPVGPRHRPARGHRHREVGQRPAGRAGRSPTARQEVRRLDPAGRQLLQGRRGRALPLDPRLLHRLPRALPQGSLDRGRLPQWARTPGRSCTRGARSSRPRASRSGSASPTTTTPAPPGGPSCGRYGGSEVAKDGKTHHLQLQGSPRGAQVHQGALQGLHDPGGPRLGRRLQQPPARLRAAARGSTTRSAPTAPSRARTRSWRTRSSCRSRPRARRRGAPSPTAAPTASPSSRRTRTAPRRSWKR